MIKWLGQLPTLPTLPPRPADWPEGVPFPPSPKPDGSPPLGWPPARAWPPPAPADWPSELAWPNPPPPPAPDGWEGPWPLSPTCWPQTLPWPPPAPVAWSQIGLPWPPVPSAIIGFTEQQFRQVLVPWWPAGCPITTLQPVDAPPAPTVTPPREPPRLTTPSAPAAPAAPTTLADALKNPVVVILLGLAAVRTIAAVVK